MSPVTKRVKKGIEKIIDDEEDSPDNDTIVNTFPDRAKEGVKNIAQGKKSNSINNNPAATNDDISSTAKSTKISKHHRKVG